MSENQSADGARAPLAHVPAHLVTGRGAAAKVRLISHLQSLQPAGEEWAVLLTDGADHLERTGRDATSHNASQPMPSSAALHLASIRGSCICCAGSLELRTTLVRLLREARPNRVIIEAPALARTGELVRALSDRWFAPVLDLRAIVLAMDENDFKPAALADEDDAERERFDHAGIVCLDKHDAQREAFVAQRMPGARFIGAPENFDAVLLDLPGPAVKPRFQSG